MAIAGEWVRQTIVLAGSKPLSTETVWKSLEKHVGQGPHAVQRAQDVLDHIDRQLIDRNDGPAMRGLWAAVADYVEKVQEANAAA